MNGEGGGDLLTVEDNKLKIGGVNEDNTPKFDEVDIHGDGLIVYGQTQELLSVQDDELKYKNEFEVQRITRKQIDYFDFSSFTYFTCTVPLTNISFNLPEGTLENAILEFTTGDTIEFTITGSNNYVINNPFEFEPNKRYIILVDAYTVLWSELQNINE